MASWNPTRQMECGDLRLHPDGNIGLGGMQLSQSCSLPNMIIGSLTIDKPEGTGSELRLSVYRDTLFSWLAKKTPNSLSKIQIMDLYQMLDYITSTGNFNCR